MYIGNEAIVDLLEDIYDANLISLGNDRDQINWQLQTFKEIRITLGLTASSDVSVNSKSFNAIKRAIVQWSQQVSGSAPIKGKGTRPQVFYKMPPLRITHPPVSELDVTDTVTLDSSQEALILKAQIESLQRRLLLATQPD